MKKSEKNAAYALLDVVLAVALFALAATGLISVMQGINETSSNFAFDRVVQDRLLSLLTETKRLDIGAMTSQAVDPDLNITFRTYVESYEIDNGEGAALTDLYLLTAEAQFVDEGGEQTERVMLLIHREEQ
ncbi:hypothetical protein N9406_09170 [Verrucomicrobiales bacterium]|jgi:hypothetical protein|nr:hypothetical protein [Verrucomicrobiales bacterium]MDB2497332.1 hypothetical protein [Verrucomicrobiales bacterium]MDB3941122.1 hypothetical protein [Verrucomicrobiales bacterium]